MARPSRCLDPDKAPQRLHWAVVQGDAKKVSDELVAAIRASVPDARVVETVQDVRALLERVEHCHAVDPRDVVPVARHESMWELRLNDHASGVHLRIYVAEVPELPNVLVALHAHAKSTTGTAAEIKAQQDEAISLALLRFLAGKADRWGYGGQS